MKYAKMLALAAMAAGALMAFIGAGTASATVICSTTASPCPEGQHWPVGTVIDFSLVPGTSATLTNTEHETLNTCTESTVKGKITKTGSSTETVTGPNEELFFKKCTLPTTVLKRGALEVHRIPGTSNGTVTADGEIEVTINEPFGSCIYSVASGTSLGDITEGKPAKFKANAVSVRTSGGLFCPPSALWDGEYVLTSPANTTLSVSDS